MRPFVTPLQRNRSISYLSKLNWGSRSARPLERPAGKEVKQRNIKNAKTVLATALKTITRGNISDQEAGILKPHMDRLKAEIADLDGGPHVTETVSDLESPPA
jgi:hypothetical protein